MNPTPFQFSLVFGYSSIKCRTIRILGNIFVHLILEINKDELVFDKEIEKFNLT